CAITYPAGTVGSLTREMLPTTSDAAAMFASASASVSPTTVGTDTGVGGVPSEKTMLTAVPSPTVVPPAGLWEITRPSATVASYTEPTVPRFNAAPMMEFTAPARFRETTLGTVVTAAPIDTVRLTPDPGGTCVPADGACEITRPVATTGSLTSTIDGASPT